MFACHGVLGGDGDCAFTGSSGLWSRRDFFRRSLLNRLNFRA
jgi:hypothetical protein